MLSIALGHAADAVCYCLGEVRELSATMTVRPTSVTIAETGESRPMIAADQVGVTGLLQGGAALSIHYRGGQPALEVLPVPERYRCSPPQGPGPSTNVAQSYARFARDYREGTHLCPTFDDALTRHRLPHAIETAAPTGHRQTLGRSGEAEDNP